MVIVWPPLVIEIVHQRGNSPEVFVRAEFARIRSNARFHREHMFAQTFRTCIFTKQFPGIFTRGHSHLSQKLNSIQKNLSMCLLKDALAEKSQLNFGGANSQCKKSFSFSEATASI